MPKIYDDLKETILKNAKEIIIEKGYQKLSMREVATKSQIAVGTIYNYFPTKDALISELMYGYWMDFIRKIEIIKEEKDEFFHSLKSVYLLLEGFIDTFKDTWVKLNGIERGMTKEHYEQKNYVMDIFLNTIEEMIVDYKKNMNFYALQEITDQKLAVFIVQNFILMAQVKQFDYDTFEKILKSYFLFEKQG